MDSPGNLRSVSSIGSPPFMHGFARQVVLKKLCSSKPLVTGTLATVKARRGRAANKAWPVAVLVLVLGLLYYGFKNPEIVRDFVDPLLRAAQSLIEALFQME